MDLLEVAGVVARGEGVLAAAALGHPAGELADRERLRALEHHVLEHVRDAGQAVELVDRADAVQHQVNHGRRAAVLADQHLHPVGQRALDGDGDRLGGSGSGRRDDRRAGRRRGLAGRQKGRQGQHRRGDERASDPMGHRVHR